MHHQPGDQRVHEYSSCMSSGPQHADTIIPYTQKKNKWNKKQEEILSGMQLPDSQKKQNACLSERSMSQRIRCGFLPVFYISEWKCGSPLWGKTLLSRGQSPSYK